MSNPTSLVMQLHPFKWIDLKRVWFKRAANRTSKIIEGHGSRWPPIASVSDSKLQCSLTVSDIRGHMLTSRIEKLITSVIRVEFSRWETHLMKQNVRARLSREAFNRNSFGRTWTVWEIWNIRNPKNLNERTWLKSTDIRMRLKPFRGDCCPKNRLPKSLLSLLSLFRL